MPTITTANARSSACGASHATPAKIGAISRAMEAPPNAAAVALTSVMPICTVAKNRSGLSFSAITARADRLPFVE